MFAIISAELVHSLEWGAGDLRKDNLRKIIAISKMYYEEDMNQEEIASKVNLSVAQVSRLLTQAKKDGYIRISVLDPFEEGNDLRRELLDRFGLKDVRIVGIRREDKRVIEEGVAQMAANYLMQIIQTNDVVGMAFSDVISKIPGLMPVRHMENISFVQLNGALSEHVMGFQYDTIRQAAAKLNAFYYCFPAPAVVSNRYIREALHQDMNIKWVIDMGKRANIAFYSVGGLTRDSIYATSGYFDSEELQNLRTEGCVGEIFGHFLRNDGELADKALDARVLGMDLTSLREKDYSVCVAAGEENTPAILSAIWGGYCNVLVTDAATAEALLDAGERPESREEGVIEFAPAYSRLPMRDCQPGLNPGLLQTKE